MTAPAATLGALDSRWTGAGRLLAVGELVADKFPGVPSRVSPPALIARAASGGWCGGTLAARAGGSRAAGIALGVAGAVGGAFGGYALRKYLTKTRGLPDPVCAVVEDALAVWSARALTAKTA